LRGWLCDGWVCAGGVGGLAGTEYLGATSVLFWRLKLRGGWSGTACGLTGCVICGCCAAGASARVRGVVVKGDSARRDGSLTAGGDWLRPALPGDWSFCRPRLKGEPTAGLLLLAGGFMF